MQDTIRAIFEPEGPLAKTLPAYEFRESQPAMAEGVLRSFFTSRHALIESGTGTGKSIAYLVPAILWASNTGNKVIVSTDTINLQEQLIHKDLPSLMDSLGLEFRYCLVKGRSNYICRRKLAMFLNEMEEETDDSLKQAYAGFISELSNVTTGSKSDFSTEPPLEIWDRVSSDSMSCIKIRCPWAERCYFLKARSQMEDSDILVTNHHLLFSDLALRIAMPENPEIRVLPEYEYLITDEAHNLPDVAEEHLGFATSFVNVQKTHNRLVNVDPTSRSRKGLLSSLRAMVFAMGENVEDSIVQKAVSYIDTAMECARRSYEASASFFQLLREFLRHASGRHSGGNNAIRLKEDITNLAAWQGAIVPQAENALIRGEELKRLLNQILELLDLLEEDADNHLRCAQGELKGILGKLGQEIHALRFIVSMEDSSFVYWATATPSDIQLRATPLNAAPYLRRHLFNKTESVILTSATIAVGGDFRFFKHQVGLDGEPDPPLEFIFDSPFDFKNQAMLLIPEDLPDPRDSQFTEEAAKVITDIVRASEGRTFVLFTAYAMLDKVEEMIRPELEDCGIRVFRQGTMPRHRMLTSFRKQPGVLLGADSFWQGVDVPGDALSCVILVKLPFQVPTNPVYEARMEALSAENIDGFASYALPSAVIRFRQGFGRLIRSSEDRGVVVVLDNRLVDKWYGQAFLSSLPPVNLMVEDTNRAAELIREWLENR